jgi:hypothetical protein
MLESCQTATCNAFVALLRLKFHFYNLVLTCTMQKRPIFNAFQRQMQKRFLSVIPILLLSVLEIQRVTIQIQDFPERPVLAKSI